MKNILNIFVLIGCIQILSGHVNSVLAESCKCSDVAVDNSFKVHGRLSLYNGTPSARIWIIGTKRILGVPDDYLPNLPDSITHLISWEAAIYGDFVVCPLTQQNPGHMQLVCIESASNLVAKKRTLKK